MGVQPSAASWVRSGATDGQEHRTPIRARQGWRARLSCQRLYAYTLAPPKSTYDVNQAGDQPHTVLLRVLIPAETCIRASRTRRPHHLRARVDRPCAVLVHARPPAAGSLKPRHSRHPHPRLPALPVRVSRRSGWNRTLSSRLRPRGADHHLCPDDHGQGTGGHRRPAARGNLPGQGLDGAAATGQPGYAGRQRRAQRVSQQHAHRRHAAAHARRRRGAQQVFAVGHPDAHGARYPGGRNGDDHRHFHQPAGGRHRPGPGPRTLQHVRFRAAGRHCRCFRDGVSVAGGSQAAARTQAAHVGYRAAGLQRRSAHPGQQRRLRVVVRGVPGADRQRNARGSNRAGRGPDRHQAAIGDDSRRRQAGGARYAGAIETL